MATQTTTANKPYLRKTPTTNRYWLDGNTATANLTATFSTSLGSSCTIARLDPELGVQWSENQTIGTTFNLITPYSYHGPMLIINRALTAAEKAVVARVMGRFMPQLGPELVTNASFGSSAGWEFSPPDTQSKWTFDGRSAVYANPSTSSSLYQLKTLTAGQQFYGTTSITAISGSARTNLVQGDANFPSTIIRTTSGVYKTAFLLATNSSSYGVRISNSGTFAGVSLKEIL